jgi:hypothetical protein
MSIWRCGECGFKGEGADRINPHSIMHLRADILLMELFNERTPTNYPIKYVEWVQK